MSAGTVIPIRGAQSIDVTKLQAFEVAVASVATAAKKHRITDDATRAGAAEHRAALKALGKQIQDSYDQHVKPVGDLVRQAQAIAKALKDVLKEGQDAIDDEIARDFRAREAAAKAERERLEQERLEKERQAREEQEARAREAAEQAERDAKAAGMTQEDAREVGTLFAEDVKAEPLPPVLHAAPPPPPPKTITSASGASVQTKKVWDFELRHIGSLAMAYPKTVEVRRGDVLDLIRCMERDGASEAAIENAIPGIRAFKRDQVSG